MLFRFDDEMLERNVVRRECSMKWHIFNMLWDDRSTFYVILDNLLRHSGYFIDSLFVENLFRSLVAIPACSALAITSMGSILA